MYVCMYMYSGTGQVRNTLCWFLLDQYFLKKKSETSSEDIGASCVLRRLVKRSEESNMENLFLPFTSYFSAGTKYLSMG